jgi:hypothetical protein
VFGSSRVASGNTAARDWLALSLNTKESGRRVLFSNALHVIFIQISNSVLNPTENPTKMKNGCPRGAPGARDERDLVRVATFNINNINKRLDNLWFGWQLSRTWLVPRAQGGQGRFVNALRTPCRSSLARGRSRNGGHSR